MEPPPVIPVELDGGEQGEIVVAGSLAVLFRGDIVEDEDPVLSECKEYLRPV